MASKQQSWGTYAFLIGVIIAIIAGIVATFMASAITGIAGIVTLVLVILGLIVGFLNIHDKHITEFLVAAIAVALIGGTAGGLVQLNLVVPLLGTVCVYIVENIVAMVVAAALVVGLKQVLALAKEQVQ